MAEKTVASVYGGDVTALMLPDEYYSAPAAEPAPDLVVGVELEIENWRSGAPPQPGWRYTEDGSLRNNGRELISVPTKTKFLRGMLDNVFRAHGIVPNADHYSERCSTHVHMNVQDFTFPQLKTFCLLYQIVERLLFGFVGNDRKDNIFCVPWYESGVTPRLIEKLTRNHEAAIGQWVKYTALNLLPVQDKGTVEFRHLYGTCDVDTIMNWVALISKMHLYAKKVSPKDLTQTVLAMNTVSNYDMFLGEVFEQFTHLLMKGNYRDDLSVGVVDTKLMLLKPSAKKPLPEDSFDEILRGLAPRRRPAPLQVEQAEVNPAGAGRALGFFDMTPEQLNAQVYQMQAPPDQIEALGREWHDLERRLMDTPIRETQTRELLRARMRDVAAQQVAAAQRRG